MSTAPHCASDQDGPDPEIDLVNRAIDHAIELRETMGRITDPLLHTLTDVLLLELGRRLARLGGE